MKTLKQALMKVKTQIPDERKRCVVYEVPCKDCDKRYIGETRRMLKVRLGEHKQAVKKGDPKNGIAVHAHESQHAIDWEKARVKRCVSGYWQRRTSEAIQIMMRYGIMNLDSSLQLPMMWNPAITRQVINGTTVTFTISISLILLSLLLSILHHTLIHDLSQILDIPAIMLQPAVFKAIQLSTLQFCN